MNSVLASLLKFRLKYLLFILLFGQMACQKKINTANIDTTGATLKNQYWKVTDIDGQKIGKGIEERELHFYLNGSSDIVNGHTGCNSFSGKYRLLGNDKIEFYQLGSTRMYCPEYKGEPLWFDLTDGVLVYEIKGNKLGLTNKKKMRAICETVIQEKQN